MIVILVSTNLPIILSVSHVYLPFFATSFGLLFNITCFNLNTCVKLLYSDKYNIHTVFICDIIVKFSIQCLSQFNTFTILAPNNSQSVIFFCRM